MTRAPRGLVSPRCDGVGALSATYAYGIIFTWLAGGLAVVLVTLLGLYVAGRLPSGHVTS